MLPRSTQVMRPQIASGICDKPGGMGVIPEQGELSTQNAFNGSQIKEVVSNRPVVGGRGDCSRRGVRLY
ncbi:hypothetical protein EVAR_63959_1 [Eumeta japonica]|uniref:Uncharacterized protein n=1 Tax=Eumeta variegata TaxID=151549 RepID=A0A4C1ZZM6_EUMVA|nr:hypothetical protein EVAR_63959_1 [Eumeta japonica]